MSKIFNATINIDAFVVPNSASKADLSWSFGIDLANQMQQIADDNNFSYNRETDKLVQLWFVGKESVRSKNLQDHGFDIDIDDVEYHFRAGALSSFLPVSFFKGRKEGDILELDIDLTPEWKITYPDTDNEQVERFSRRNRHMEDYEDNPEAAPIFKIHFIIKLNQQEYRYRRFGNFEDVIAYVS